MKISINHTNRKLSNWLVYSILDRFLIKYSKHYKGDIYDLGCGDAPFKDFFLKYGTKYIGVDWTNTLHNSQADIVSDLNLKLNIEDEVADTIVSISVMEHLSEPQTFLNESFRVLKKDGVMMLQAPWQWWIHEAPYDYFRYSCYGLKYMFEKAGFTDVEVEPNCGYFSTRILKFNYFTSRFIRGPLVFKFIVKLALMPMWTIGQFMAPFLDKLDRNWNAETQGYFVIAKK